PLVAATTSYAHGLDVSRATTFSDDDGAGVISVSPFTTVGSHVNSRGTSSTAGPGGGAAEEGGAAAGVVSLAGADPAPSPPEGAGCATCSGAVTSLEHAASTAASVAIPKSVLRAIISSSSLAQRRDLQRRRGWLRHLAFR